MDLQIISADSLTTHRGDFGAAIEGDRLAVPTSVSAVLQRRHLHTAGQLVAYAASDPVQLASDLGWTEQDLSRARAALTVLLRGKVDARILGPPVARRRSFGARAPGT